MTNPTPNIVQMELQLAPGAFLDHRKKAGRERSLSRRQKTVIRFYDRDGFISPILRQAGRIRNKKKAAERLVVRSRGLERLYHSLRYRYHSHRYHKVSEKAAQAAGRELREALMQGGAVGLEPSEIESFREIRGLEITDLKHDLTTAQDTWLFLFPYGDLFADNPGRIVAYSK